MKENIHKVEYEEKFVCFVDILGFKDAIIHCEHKIFNRDPSYFYHALSTMRKPPNDLEMNNFKVTQFSDCVAISFPFSDHQHIQLYMLINRIVELQQFLLEGALLTRGAVAKGTLFHDDSGIIFGPALIDAILLGSNEKGNNPYPLVKIDSKLKDDINAFELSNRMITSEHNFDYVEYIKYYPNNDPEQIKIIQEIIRYGLNHKCQGVRKKYEWLNIKWHER